MDISSIITEIEIQLYLGFTTTKLSNLEWLNVSIFCYFTECQSNVFVMFTGRLCQIFKAF